MYSRQEALIASIMTAADKAGLLTDPPIPSEPDTIRSLLRVAIPRSSAIAAGAGSTTSARQVPASLVTMRRRFDDSPLKPGRPVGDGNHGDSDGAPDNGGPDPAEFEGARIAAAAGDHDRRGTGGQ